MKSGRQITRKRQAFGSDASHFASTTSVDSPPRCAWRGCDTPPFSHDIPVCLIHGLMISDYVLEALSFEGYEVRSPHVSTRQSFVYYLMVGPSTVKIGTTINLPTRLNALRTDLQYVVAIERGDFRQEHRRHEQFASERIGRREDFRLSERLKRHIDELIPQRDELISLATTFKP